MGNMFDALDGALSEALEYVRGNVKLPSKVVFIPASPKHYKAKDIKKLRTKLNFSQKDFASWLNVSLNTVQSWEQGIRQPSHSSLRLLEIFDKGFPFIEEICKAEHKSNKNKSQKKTVHSGCAGGLSKTPIAAKAK